MKVRGRHLLVTAAAAAAAVVVLAGVASSLRPASVPSVTVVRGPFVVRVTVEGNLRALKATSLSTPVDAEGAFKVAWMAPEGSSVAAGEVVVRFDETSFADALAASESDRAVAGEQITKSLAQGEATARGLDRDAALAGHELETARTFQSKDAEIYSRFEIVSSEIDATLAQRRKEHAEAVKGVRTGLLRTDLDLLGIERHKAELEVGKAESGLKAVEVRAPHDGLVVYRRDWRGNPLRVGESVWPGARLGEIPSLDIMEAEVFVLEPDAGGLAAGQRATVTVEGRGETTYPATVRMVDAIAKPRFRNVPVQYFGAVLTLQRTDPAVMKPGQRVQAVLAVVDLPDALAVPRQAVFSVDGKEVAYRRTFWGRYTPVEVTLGPVALGRVVIEHGLAAGDIIAVVDPTRPPDDAHPPATAAPAIGGGR